MPKPKSLKAEVNSEPAEVQGEENVTVTLSQYSLQLNNQRNVDFLIFFVVPYGETQFNCSRHLSRAASAARRSNLASQWLELDQMDFSEIIPKPGNIFVLDTFDGASFDYFAEELEKSKNFMVIGPQSLQSILLGSDWDVSSINRGYPVFTLGMRGFIITLAGFKDKNLETKIADLILKIGGSISPEINHDVTHVVAYRVLTPECIYAYSHGIPVMSEEWIHHIWRESSESTFHATVDPRFHEFECQLFHNMQFCMSQMQNEQKGQLKRLITSRGGEYMIELVKEETDILITPKGDGREFIYSTTWEIPCVKPEWIYACKKSRHIISLENFRVDGAAKARLSRFLATKEKTPQKKTPNKKFATATMIEPYFDVEVNLHTGTASSSYQVSPTAAYAAPSFDAIENAVPGSSRKRENPATHFVKSSKAKALEIPSTSKQFHVSATDAKVAPSSGPVEKAMATSSRKRDNPAPSFLDSLKAKALDISVPSTSKYARVVHSRFEQEKQNELEKRKNTNPTLKLILVGFEDKPKDQLERNLKVKEIQFLGGDTDYGTEFYRDAEVVVIAKGLFPDEKTFCAIASGKKILHTSYVTESAAAGKFLPNIDDYLWREGDGKNFNERCLANSYAYWYARINTDPVGKPYTKFRALILMTDRINGPMFTNIILAGGGQIIQNEKIEAVNVIICFSTTMVSNCLGPGKLLRLSKAVVKKHPKDILNIINYNNNCGDDFFAKDSDWSKIYFM